MPDRPRVVIGSSLGGMVALELADLVDAQQVVLIGSALSATEVRPLLRTLIPLAAVTPLGLCRALAGSAPGMLSAMYAEQDPAFIRAAIQAIPGWAWGGQRPVFRIHGRHDRLIHAQHADCWLAGGHLLAMTHADDCVSAITGILAAGP